MIYKMLKEQIHFNRSLDHLEKSQSAINLGFSPEKYKQKQFNEIVTNVNNLDIVSQAQFFDVHDLSYQFIDSIPIIKYSHTFPLSFHEFKKKININALPRIIYDPLQWACRGLVFNKNGKVTCQASRLVFHSNKLLEYDVNEEMVDSCRLEKIHYRKNSQSIYWKIVKSLNNSINHDEGRIIVSKMDENRTQCEILVKQGTIYIQSESLEIHHKTKENISQKVLKHAKNWILHITNFIEKNTRHDEIPLSNSTTTSTLPEALNIPYLVENNNYLSLLPSLYLNAFPSLISIATRLWISKYYRAFLKKEAYDSSLEYMLRVMIVIIDKSILLKQNIQNFSGKYLFVIKESKRNISVVFKNSKMIVSKGITVEPDVTIKFRDTTSVLAFLLTPKPDVLKSMLNQDIAVDGNINYLFRFAYIANKLKTVLQEKGMSMFKNNSILASLIPQTLGKI